jgi:WhiB family transcriptional regulator, redox-sensing transcriptional regulator
MSSAPEFLADAPCARVDPDVMFPNPRNRKAVKAAKQICQGCDFRGQCLEWALAPGTRISEGVAGGLSENERRDIKKGRPRPYSVGPIPPKNQRHARAA